MGAEDSELRLLAQAREADGKLDDFDAELSGTKSGYAYRTSAADRENRPDIRAKKARKADAALSALQQLLNDPEYAKVYAEARQTIGDFRQQMKERLEQLEQRIEALDEKLENLPPGSPEHQRLTKQRDDAQRKQQKQLDYDNDVIRPMENRMNDPDNPPSKDELDEFDKKVRKDMDGAFKVDQVAQVTPETESPRTSTTIIPNITG